jgi:hypothetical protein
MSSPLDLFALGSVVELHGLVSAPHHNGRRGVVYGAKNERLSVQLEKVSGSETPAPLAVKPSDSPSSIVQQAWGHSAAFGKRLRQS